MERTTSKVAIVGAGSVGATIAYACLLRGVAKQIAIFDVKLPQKVARETGARLVVLAPSVGAEKRITSYLDLFDHDLALLAGASPRGEGRP